MKTETVLSEEEAAPHLLPSVISAEWVVENFWLEVEHDGTATWDDLQAIKNLYFGSEAECFEKYPRQSEVLNSGNYRHLFLFPNILKTPLSKR